MYALVLQESEKRNKFMEKVSSLMKTMMQKYLPTDSACDQLGKQFIQDSLPPYLTNSM